MAAPEDRAEASATDELRGSRAGDGGAEEQRDAAEEDVRARSPARRRVWIGLAIVAGGFASLGYRMADPIGVRRDDEGEWATICETADAGLGTTYCQEGIMLVQHDSGHDGPSYRWVPTGVARPTRQSQRPNE